MVACSPKSKNPKEEWYIQTTILQNKVEITHKFKSTCNKPFALEQLHPS